MRRAKEELIERRSSWARDSRQGIDSSHPFGTSHKRAGKQSIKKKQKLKNNDTTHAKLFSKILSTTR